MKQIIVVILALIGAVSVAGYLGMAVSRELDRRRRRWEWAHPPEEYVCREDDENDQR